MRYPKATRADLTAPSCKFRVLAVDVETDPTTIYAIGDFGSFVAAEEAAAENAGIGKPVYIYNDSAEPIVRYGSCTSSEGAAELALCRAYQFSAAA